MVVTSPRTWLARTSDLLYALRGVHAALLRLLVSEESRGGGKGVALAHGRRPEEP